MKSLDTNVLARWLLRDDDAQAAVADAIMDGPVEITLPVLLELGWVLTSIGGMTREQFADSLVWILSIDAATFADRDGLRWAADRYRAGADWADMMHLVATSHARTFATFDKSLARHAGAASPVAIEVIGT